MIHLSIGQFIATVVSCVFAPTLFTFLITTFAKERYIERMADRDKDRENYRLKKRNKELTEENKKLIEIVKDQKEHLHEIKASFISRDFVSERPSSSEEWRGNIVKIANE